MDRRNRNRMRMLAAAVSIICCVGCGSRTENPLQAQDVEGSALRQTPKQEAQRSDGSDQEKSGKNLSWQSPSRQSSSALSWDRAQAIAQAVQEPDFPEYTVDIRDFGAKPDDGLLDTEAIRRAIDQVSAAGGGTVQVPSGIFDTGAIELKAGVNLNLAEPDSVLRFSREIVQENYPLVLSYYEGIACYNWSPLIYAYDQDHIAVTGPGLLDGQADETTWWSWYGNVGMGRDFSRPSSSDVTLLRKMNDEGVEVRKRIFGEGHYLRPNFIQMIGCRNVLIENVTIENSPMWGINPVLCTSVTVRGVTIRGKWNNNDGCNPENSRLVLIENCCFQTEGDGISIKSGRGRDGWVLREQGFPAGDILIRNNEFCTGSSGIAFGSEMSGGICDVYADQNRFGTEHLDYGIRFKSNADRGGVIQRIYIRNSEMEQIENVAVHGTVYYGEGWNGTHLPEFRDIRIEYMRGTGGEYGIFMEAFEKLPFENLQLRHIHLDQVGYGIRAVNWSNPVMEDVVINGKRYPRPMNVKAEGTLAPGHEIEGTAQILGGEEAGLSYRWKLIREGEQEAELVGTGKRLWITEDMAGGRLILWVTDSRRNAESSMEYRILSSETDRLYPSESVKYGLARGYVDEEELNLDGFVTNRDCAKVLARFWNLEGSLKLPVLQDVAADDPDYPVIAGVVENGYMSLKRQSGEVREHLVYQNITEGEPLWFDPDAVITRGELGQIALLACGIPYEEMMTLEPEFKDSGDIQPQYRSSVGVSAALGFVRAKEEGRYLPLDRLTWGEFVETIEAISRFNNR